MQLINHLTQSTRPPIALRFQSAPFFSVRELSDAFMDLRLSGQRLVSLEEIGKILDKTVEVENVEP